MGIYSIALNLKKENSFPTRPGLTHNHEHTERTGGGWSAAPCSQMTEKHNKHTLKTPNKPLILAVQLTNYIKTSVSFQMSAVVYPPASGSQVRNTVNSQTYNAMEIKLHIIVHITVISSTVLT